MDDGYYHYYFVTAPQELKRLLQGAEQDNEEYYNMMELSSGTGFLENQTDIFGSSNDDYDYDASDDVGKIYRIILLALFLTVILGIYITTCSPLARLWRTCVDHKPPPALDTKERKDFLQRVLTKKTVKASDLSTLESNNEKTASSPDDSNKKNTFSAPLIECSICLAEYQPGEEICSSKNKSCSHVFHYDCIKSWLVTHDECPCCRCEFIVLVDENDNDDSSDNDNNNNNIFATLFKKVKLSSFWNLQCFRQNITATSFPTTNTNDNDPSNTSQSHVDDDDDDDDNHQDQSLSSADLETGNE